MAMATATIFGKNIMPETEVGETPLWRIIPRGLSQLCFQTNEITGVLFMVAVLTFNWQMAVLAIMGASIGTLVAMGMKSDRFLTELGLFGFNSALIGLSLGSFFEFSILLVVWVAVLAAVAGAIMALATKFLPFPVVAAPFILTFWAFWPMAEKMGLHKAQFPPFDDVPVEFFNASVTAMGAALFCGSLLAGVIFLVALAISSWRAAIIALCGVMLAHAFAASWNPLGGGAVNSGFLGFNAVLCSVAVYTLAGEDIRLALFGAVGATAVFGILLKTDIPILASGFVIMFWIILFLGWFGNNFFNAKPPAEAVE
jgi:urea transporter